MPIDSATAAEGYNNATHRCCPMASTPPSLANPIVLTVQAVGLASLIAGVVLYVTQAIPPAGRLSMMLVGGNLIALPPAIILLWQNSYQKQQEENLQAIVHLYVKLIKLELACTDEMGHHPKGVYRAYWAKKCQKACHIEELPLAVVEQQAGDIAHELLSYLKYLPAKEREAREQAAELIVKEFDLNTDEFSRKITAYSYRWEQVHDSPTSDFIKRKEGFTTEQQMEERGAIKKHFERLLDIAQGVERGECPRSDADWTTHKALASKYDKGTLNRYLDEAIRKEALPRLSESDLRYCYRKLCEAAGEEE